MIVMIQRQWFFITVIFFYPGLYTKCVFVIMIISIENSWVINKTQSVIYSVDWLVEHFHIFITAGWVALYCKYSFYVSGIKSKSECKFRFVHYDDIKVLRNARCLKYRYYLLSFHYYEPYISGNYGVESGDGKSEDDEIFIDKLN